MKNFLLFIILIVIISAFTACGNNHNGITIDSSLTTDLTTSASGESKIEPAIIKGFSLDDYDLKINVDPTIIFNKNSKDEQQYSYGISGGISINDNTCLYGSWSEISALIPPDAFNYKNNNVDDFATSNLIVMYLQVIPKYRLERHDFVKVNGIEYGYDDLESYVVVENEKYIIYDFTSLIYNGRTYEEYLNDYIPCDGYSLKEDYDASWTKNVYDYFHNNIKQIIQ